MVMTPIHEKYMWRCLQLAELGAGNVAPNPMVGAVLVYQDRIIGEGYHQQYGAAHAEVNCLFSVGADDRRLIPESTLYVSLEPCAHYGKTPPCAKLIIEEGIKKVVVGCRDPFKEVDGRGMDMLRAAGIEVTSGVLEQECEAINKRFFHFHRFQQPYVLLKWAQSADGFISGNPTTVIEADESGMALRRTMISNEFTNRLVHQWRSEEAAILVGTRTAHADDPQLNTRLWPGGKTPLRLVIDKDGILPADLQIFTDGQPTVVFGYRETENQGAVRYVRVKETENLLPQILSYLHEQKILSVMVEGGAALLQSFIHAGNWQEARVIINETLFLQEGLAAPHLQHAYLVNSQNLAGDRILTFRNPDLQA